MIQWNRPIGVTCRMEKCVSAHAYRGEGGLHPQMLHRLAIHEFENLTPDAMALDTIDFRTRPQEAVPLESQAKEEGGHRPDPRPDKFRRTARSTSTQRWYSLQARRIRERKLH